MASIGMENASSSSTVQWKYDVFISFRGEDTRNNFTDHLYKALIGKGINTFRDDEKLERGKPISELLKAIEESRFTVVILSKDYASSPWCLDELAEIIACKEDMGMIVLPVFHYVEPSDVRKQMGTFAQAFVKHEEKEEKTRVDKWRDALRQVGNLAGWHLKDTRNIVCQECLDDPGKRSRLWDYKDINKVLKKNKGTEALKAIDIASTCNEQQDGSWNPEAFLRMDNLKFLRIYGTLYVPTHLPNDLRILDWISYPSKSLPSSFQLDELVQLRLQQSKIQRLWTGIKNFDKLKFIDLTDSLDLFITPDFTGVPNLEKLVLVRCTNLRQFDPSIGILKKLKYLNLQDCERLIRLPSKFAMESLETLEISNCPKKRKTIPKFVANPKFLQELSLDRSPIVDLIKNLPENLGIIKGLEILDLSKADIEELPSSIERLTGLTSLTLRYCKNLVSFPNTICNLELLKSLDLFGCLKFHNLPKNIGNVKGLELLNLCWTAIRDVPSSIALLKNLKNLYICRWKSFEFYSLPTSLERLGSVFPSLISASHVNPIISGCQMSSERGSRQPLQLLLPSLLGLQSLTDLHLSDCSLLSIPNDIGCLSSLEHLNLSGNDFVSLPESMSQLSNLRRLHLEGCKMLWSLENVPSTIDSVIANNCTSLMILPELQFYIFRSDHSHLNFQCVNCFSLARYIGSSGSMLQGQSGKLPDIFDIIIPEGHFPEGRFPERFEHEFVSHELEVQVPYGHDELMGIELCVCFSVVEASKDFQLKCWIKVNGFESPSPIRSSFRANYGRVSSRHLWWLYLSPHYFNSQWGENFRQIDGNGSNKVEIRISTSNILEVEKVGIHYDIINDSASKGTQNKRSHDEDDGAKPFGEGYSIDEPPPKIRKFLTALFEEIACRRRDKLSRGIRLVRTRIRAAPDKDAERSATMCVRWKRPGQGKLKLNIDGSAQGNSGLAGDGGVLRDDEGNWVLGYSRKIERTTSFLAEWWALRDGLHLCLSKNHLDVEVELDAKIIVDALTTTQQSDQPVSPLMDDCRFMATRFNHIQFKHCYREANKCANGLARKGVTQIDDFFVYDNPPVELENSFIHDLNGVYFKRRCTATASLLDL